MIEIGTFTGTGSNDNLPEITWRNQTKEEALKVCYQRFAEESNAIRRERKKLLADYKLRIAQYNQERNEIIARYEDE